MTTRLIVLDFGVMLATCTWCGSDEYVEDHDESSDLAVCVGPGHPGPRMFEPKAEAVAQAEAGHLDALPDGIAASYGLYDILPRLLSADEWADTVVVEYRYAIENPNDYGSMLQRWGHVINGPRHYSVTSFIGSTLGHLFRGGLISMKTGRGSGFFRYNSTIGYWAALPVADGAAELSWASFAPSVDVDPEGWPLA